MASTYTGLGVELMATGENAGTWGSKTNINLQIIEQIAGGYTAVNFATDADITLSVSDGATGAALAHRVLEFTGTITASRNVTIPLDVQTFYILKNSTSGSQNVVFKYASGSGTTATVANGKTIIAYARADDGTNPNITAVEFGGDVVDDTTPQLGGNLDVNGNSIVSASGGNIAITPDTSGNIILDGLTFPNADGSNGQVLQTNGSGTLSFTTPSSGITMGKAIAAAIVFG